MACENGSFFLRTDMKKRMIVIAYLLMICAQSAQAANDRMAEDILEEVREVIASKDRRSMSLLLVGISAKNTSDAVMAIQMLLDAGADGAYVLQQYAVDILEFTALSNAAMELIPENIRVLKEWSEAHGNVIDPNTFEALWFDFSKNPSLLGGIVDIKASRERFDDKLHTIEGLLQFQNIKINQPDETGRSPLHSMVQNSLNHETSKESESFEANLNIIKLLKKYDAEVSDSLFSEVDAALATGTISPIQYDQIMEALSPEPTVKAAGKA